MKLIYLTRHLSIIQSSIEISRHCYLKTEDPCSQVFVFSKLYLNKFEKTAWVRYKLKKL